MAKRISYINIKNYSGVKYDFDELSSDLKKVAQQNFIATQDVFFASHKSKLKSLLQVKGGLNKRINNPYFWSCAVSCWQLNNKIKNNEDYCKDIIKANLCEFTDDGTYITYMLK